MFCEASHYVYARCTPGATYSTGTGLSCPLESSCPINEEGYKYVYHTRLGKFSFYHAENTPGAYLWDLWGVEWSPEINEQEAVYSLDEIGHNDGEDGEELTAEEKDKWSQI